MAPKKQPHNLPSPTNTSDSETDSQENSTSSDDSDLQPQQLTQTKPQQDSSDSDKTQKPLSPEPKKPTQSKANGKRPAEIDHIDKVNKNKKSKGVEKVVKGSKSVDKDLKKSNGDEEGGDIDDKKANLFVRLFTEKDEIVLLEGMIDFKEKNKGADPSLNIVAFHEAVEDLLSCSVTKSQISDKIRRLKKKYVNNLKKGRNGEDPVISRPHEYKSFELSKKIWGGEGLGSEVNGDSKVKRSSRIKDDNAGSKTPVKSVGKETDFEEEVMGKSEVEKEDCRSLYPLLCASLESEASKNFTGPMSPKDYVKKVVSGLDKDKARELEQEWKDFCVMEHQVYAKMVKVRSKQAEAAMNVIQH